MRLTWFLGPGKVDVTIGRNGRVCAHNDVDRMKARRVLWESTACIRRGRGALVALAAAAQFAGNTATGLATGLTAPPFGADARRTAFLVCRTASFTRTTRRFASSRAGTTTHACLAATGGGACTFSTRRWLASSRRAGTATRACLAASLAASSRAGTTTHACLAATGGGACTFSTRRWLASSRRAGTATRACLAASLAASSRAGTATCACAAPLRYDLHGRLTSP